MITLLILMVSSALVNTDQQACLQANAQSNKQTINICNIALQSEGVSLDSKTIIYITQANYLIRNNDFDEANHILDRAFNSNHKILENNLFRYNWLRTKGSLYFVKGEYFNAKPFYLQALEVAKAMNKKINIANVFNDLGAVNLEQNKYKQALEWLQKSLSIFYQTNDIYRAALSLANIAEIYVDLNDENKALEYFNKSIDSLSNAIIKGGDNHQLHEVSLAKIHISLGNLYISLTNSDMAMTSLIKALSIYQKNNLQPEQIDILSSLGKLSFQRSEIDVAISLFKQATDLETSIAATINLELLENRINAYIFIKKLDKAEQLSFQGVEQSKLRNNSKFEVKFLHLLAKIYQQKEEFEKAINYLKQAQRINQQFLQNKFNNSRGQLLAEIDLVEKQRQLEILEKQQSIRELDISKQHLLFVMASFLLLATIAYLLFKLKRKKKLKQSLQSDQVSHHHQLELLIKSPAKLKTLLNGIESQYICFNSAGLIRFSSSKARQNYKDKTNMMKDEFPKIWKIVMQHMNEEEKLDNEIFLEIDNTNENFLSIWTHQMDYLNNTIICLLLDSKIAQKQGFIDAENIRKYTQFNDQLSMFLSYINRISMKNVVQLKQVTTALKTLNIKSSLNKIHISQDEYKRILVDLMHSSIDLWLSNTTYSTIELAEKSGLWLVSIEDGQLRTRTMNRYTDTMKIPNNPRWRQVVGTAHFIISNCDLKVNEREQLNTKINAIKQFIRNQAFND